MIKVSLCPPVCHPCFCSLITVSYFTTPEGRISVQAPTSFPASSSSSPSALWFCLKELSPFFPIIFQFTYLTQFWTFGPQTLFCMFATLYEITQSHGSMIRISFVRNLLNFGTWPRSRAFCCWYSLLFVMPAGAVSPPWPSRPSVCHRSDHHLLLVFVLWDLFQANLQFSCVYFYSGILVTGSVVLDHCSASPLCAQNSSVHRFHFSTISSVARLEISWFHSASVPVLFQVWHAFNRLLHVRQHGW